MENTRPFKNELALVFAENLVKNRHEHPDEFAARCVAAIETACDLTEENLLELIEKGEG